MVVVAMQREVEPLMWQVLAMAAAQIAVPVEVASILPVAAAVAAGKQVK